MRAAPKGVSKGRGLRVLLFLSLFILGLGGIIPRASAMGKPLITKYGFAPFFSILKIRSPAYSHFQFLGPFVFRESSKKEEVFGFRPLFSRAYDRDHGNIRWDILYPLSRLQYGEKNQKYFLLFYRSDQYRSNKGKRFYLFPFFWGETVKGQTYGGVFPFYGHLINRFQKDDIRFVLWPLYSRSRKDGFIRTNFIWPFFTYFSGNKGKGFRFWPLVGHEVKKGIYQKDYCLWPFFIHTKLDMDKDPVERWWFFPFYGKRERLPYYHQTDVLWPVFRNIKNDEFHYTRYDAWPIFTRAHGDYDHWLRIFPFYVHETRPNYEKRTTMWPFLRRKRYRAGDTEVDRSCFMIFSQFRKEKNPGKPWQIKRANLWPLFCDARLRGGHSWVVPDPIPIVYTGYRRDWRPIWTFAGGEQRGRIHESRVLWGLYDHVHVGNASLTDIAGLLQWEQEGKEIYRFSLLQGLIKYENMRGHVSLRLFFLPWRLRWRATENKVCFEEEPWNLR